MCHPCFSAKRKSSVTLSFLFLFSIVCKSLKCTHSLLLHLGMSCDLGMKRAIANGDGG